MVQGYLGRRVLGKAASRRDINLMIFPVAAPEVATCGIPSVLAVHDLQHRLQPEFPEVSAQGIAEWREGMYSAAIPAAGAVLVDSDTGKEDVVTCYGIDPERIHVLPYVPALGLSGDVPDAEILRVRAKYQLPEKFIFYPAQFWPHKNHLRLIEAVSRIDSISVVFAGSEDVLFSTAPEARRRAESLLPGRARFLGYLPQEDMAPVYAAATMLVMPTFFGPTNIPVLEAWSLGIPVITSDIRGIREQAGDAALLANPKDVDQLTERISRLLGDADLCRTLIANGRQKMKDWSNADFSDRLRKIVDSVKVPGARAGRETPSPTP